MSADHMADLQRSFNTCPLDIQKLVISWLDLDLKSALRLQATSKAFQKSIWETLSRFDCSLVAESVVQVLLDRVNPTSLLSLDLSKSKEAIGSEELLKLRNKFPNLVNLAVKFKKDNMVNDHIKQLVEEQSGSLAELVFYNEVPDLDLLKQCSRTLRVVLNVESGILASMLNEEDRSTINYNITTETKFQAQAPIQIQEAVTCGSSLGEYTFIGTESGTLYIYKDTKSPAGLVLERVVSDLHSGRINSITLAHDQMVVASMDGFVTAWIIDSEMDGDKEVRYLGLKAQIQFHEPIFHTFYSKPSEYYLAASKRTVYIHNGCIINTIDIRDDITGVHLTGNKQYLISTEKNLYVLTGELQEVNSPVESTISAPNMCLSPDESLITIASNTNRLKMYDVASMVQLLQEFEICCDCQPGIVSYNPIAYIITYLENGVICSWNLESKAVVSMYTPRMSKKEMREKRKLTCKRIWYSTDGARFFALYSDNTLHCWLDKARCINSRP